CLAFTIRLLRPAGLVAGHGHHRLCATSDRRGGAHGTWRSGQSRGSMAGGWWRESRAHSRAAAGADRRRGSHSVAAFGGGRADVGPDRRLTLHPAWLAARRFGRAGTLPQLYLAPVALAAGFRGAAKHAGGAL